MNQSAETANKSVTIQQTAPNRKESQNASIAVRKVTPTKPAQSPQSNAKNAKNAKIAPRDQPKTSCATTANKWVTTLQPAQTQKYSELQDHQETSTTQAGSTDHPEAMATSTANLETITRIYEHASDRYGIIYSMLMLVALSILYFLFHESHCCWLMPMQMGYSLIKDFMDKEIKDHYQVIIIGAGAAGIGAATRLLRENVPIVVLEARNRIGGRLLTQNLNGVGVDLGASWIHSYGPNNPLKPYVRKHKLEQVVLSKRKGGRMFIDGEKGHQFDQTTQQSAHCITSYFFRQAQKSAGSRQWDRSIYESGKQYLQKTLQKSSRQQKRCIQLIINMTQHYEASTIRDLSINNYEFREDEGCDFMPCGGYGRFIMEIAQDAKVDVHCGRVVERVGLRQGRVLVECRDGTKYKGNKLICSLPLGVLKSKTVTFQPPLPNPYIQSISKLGMGLMNKIIMEFTKPFWDPVSWLSIGFNERGKFSQIFDISQSNKYILCCFITDDFARKCQMLTDQDIVHQFLKIMQKVYEGCEVEVLDYRVTRWGMEEFSRGSYTSFHVGSSPEDCYQLRKPINDTLWLVGEHCYAEHIGTAHGAFRTGEWAADQVLKSLKWVNPIYKQKKTQKK